MACRAPSNALNVGQWGDASTLCLMIYVSLLFSNRTFRLWTVTSSLDLLGFWSEPFILLFNAASLCRAPTAAACFRESELLQASSKKVPQQRLKLSSLPPWPLQMRHRERRAQHELGTRARVLNQGNAFTSNPTSLLDLDLRLIFNPD